MSETEAIAIMAEKLSAEILGTFKWEKTGPVNQNWACVFGEKHFNKKTHPSDVVFYYKDPYSAATIYVNTDLKSYSKATISLSKIKSAVRNLHLATECANSSSEWQELYVQNKTTPKVHSMLFIYNHDDNYDADFDALLAKVDIDLDCLPEKSRVFVFGPKNVCQLNTIANDIKASLFDKKSQSYEFLYPHLAQKANVVEKWEAPATLEALTSGWLTLQYKPEKEGSGVIIYYRRNGETREEFMYLIDYLFHFQIVRDYSPIEIKLVEPCKVATANFNKAINCFLNECEENDVPLVKRQLENITIKQVTNVIAKFSETEIGLEER
jgi:hypothetical protein